MEICRDGLNAAWGFRLYGGTDFESPLIVQRVTPSSAAADALQTGDVIIKINHVDTLRLKHAQALDLIAAAGSSLKLTVLRGTNAAHNVPPRTPSRGTTPVPGGMEDGDTKVPKLADIMKESLHLKEQGQLHTIRTQGFRGTPLSRRSPQLPTPPRANSMADITSYLPQLPPKRAGSRGRETPVRNYVSNARSSSDYNPLSPTSSGRSSPSSSVIELGDPNAPKSIGVWVPPVHQPNAKLVHLQYNTPLGLYSAYNVADSVEKMTGTKIEWTNQQSPGQRYLDDIRESPTYKFIQEMEGRSPSKPKRSSFEQSRTIKNLNRYFRLEDGTNSNQ